MSLVGETTNDFYISYDIINHNKTENSEEQYENEEDNSNSIQTPEDLIRKCCISFLEDLFYVKLFLIIEWSSRYSSSVIDIIFNGFIDK